VGRPGIILADEPTGELDSASGQEIVQLFRRIVEEDKVTVVMSSHDPSVEELADVVYELRDGRVVSVSGLRRNPVSDTD
jgi:ABC-type lipoprotein export system ATPase subunit